MKRVRITASATSALPRSLLIAICVIYVLAGLFGRDPWKNEDAAGFGVMWTMAHGHLSDWLLPNIAGKPIYDSGPLVSWLGALAIRAFSWLDAPDAARVVTGLCFYATCTFIWYGTYLLGRRPEVQPFKYAFGGEPEPRDYGRTLADGALLILLACFGLAERGHETTSTVGQLTLISMAIYGLVRSLDKPRQGAMWFGLALGGMALACPGRPSITSGAFPFSPSTGQPSSHFIGIRYGIRPTAPLSRKSIAYHLPSGVSKMPPCAMPRSAITTRPSYGPVILSARKQSSVRIPPRGQVIRKM